MPEIKSLTGQEIVAFRNMLKRRVYYQSMLWSIITAIIVSIVKDSL